MNPRIPQEIIEAGLLAGFVCGLCPLIVAMARHKSLLGMTAMVACLLAGMILGLIAAIPVSVGFTVAAAINSAPQNNPPPQ